MLAGDAYLASDPELVRARDEAATRLSRYNAADGWTEADRLPLLRALVGEAGDGCVVRPPFHCDYGTNIALGCDVFLNFGCVILDVVRVSIGDGTQIGPGVQILAADHPRDPALRRAGFESGKPIGIGANVWIGGGALILPGVSVGDDAIVGAGSVVTRDVPAGATVAGNPARIVRPR